MKKKNLVFFSLILITLWGCNKDTIIDDPAVEVDKGVVSLLDYELNEEKVLVWLPEHYQTAEDVRIESADTSMISISKSFYDRLEQSIGAESVLNITLSDEDLPFIRKVGFVDPQGDRYFIETEQATLEDIFKNLDVQISSEPYYSEANVSRAGGNPAAGFIDAAGVVHPVKYIVEYPDGSREVIDLQNEMTRAKMDLNLSWKDQIKITPPTPGWLKLQIGLKNELTGFAHMEIKINKFKLQKIEARIGGSVNLDVPISMELQAQLIKDAKLDHDLLKGPKFTAVVWIGVVPLSIGITPKLNFSAELKARGTLQSSFGFHYDMKYETGALYLKDVGWSPISNFEQHLNTYDFKASAEAEARAKAGLYAKLALDLYGVELIGAKIGAYIDGQAGAKVSTQTDGLDINFHCDWGIDAGLEAKVKILKYTLASWSTTLNIYGPVVICDYEKTYNWSELGNLFY